MLAVRFQKPEFALNGTEIKIYKAHFKISIHLYMG